VINQTSPTFSLENFEGPLELLLFLIQKEEIDVCDITLKKLTQQFMEALEALPEVEVSSETLALTATLLLIKSQRLLPKAVAQEEMPLEDPRVELIQSLIEYCQIKESAKLLSLREEEQQTRFPRATQPFRKEIGTGLEDVAIDHLKTLLNELLKRASKETRIIEEEEWQTAHQLTWLKEFLNSQKKVAFKGLFSSEKSRIQLIVLFLALLEMLKNQEAKIASENENLYIISTNVSRS
jgi:segregation and condensation protein A